MKSRLFKNIPAKLFALIISSILWLHVSTERTYEHIFWYPLSVEGLPEELTIGAPLPDSIGVAIKGRGKDLIGLLFQNGKISIDARGFKYSERFIELSEANVKIPEGNYRVTGFTRKEPLRVVIDRYARKSVPVVNALELVPSRGYIALPEKITFEPEFVVLGGPEQLVQLLNQASTEQETLRDLSSSTTIVVGIQNFSSLLTYTPEKIIANIVVEPVFQKKFEEIPVQVKGGYVPHGKILVPNIIDIVFAGTKENIDSLSKDRISVFIDYVDMNARGNKLKPIIIHPPGVSVVSMNPEYFSFGDIAN